MSDLNISLILRLVDKATAPARAALRQIDRLSGDGFSRNAARVAAGSKLMRSGLGDLGRTATAGTGLIAAYGAGMVGLAAKFVGPAAQFERFETQLTTLEGSAAGAKRAMDWIEGFATRTPLQMEETVAAYARLKAFGIDPTNGSMQALVDTMAATGGGAEQLDGLVLALGQAWSKGKLQGEEAMQMLERGVPVWDLLAGKLRKHTEEVQAMAAKGQLGREEIGLLVEALGEANAGASERMAGDWDGMVSNLWDYWSKFQRMVMGSGLFVFLKSRLKSLLELLDQMARDGRLQQWADAVGRAIRTALEAIWEIGTGVADAWREISPWIIKAKDALGGWAELAAAIVALLFANTLTGIAWAFGKIALGAAMALPGLVGIIWAAGSAALAALPGILQAVGGALKIIWVWTLANPYVAALVALAALGAGIYYYWDEIVEYFRGVIDTLKRWFTSLKETILDAFAPPDPSKWDSLVERGKNLRGTLPQSPADQGEIGNYLDGQRALGGPVRAGMIYRWMEEGQEFFSPRTDGAVISTRDLRALRAGGGGRSIRIGDIVINAAPGQSAAEIARAVRREIGRLIGDDGPDLHDGGAYAA
ncbi:tape measure protein [Albidovulum sp.]|uniref:tape measure protein n=1 Tax=Albidovulum sp. TaxID=1872424 RepID=UPI0039B9261D